MNLFDTSMSLDFVCWYFKANLSTSLGFLEQEWFAASTPRMYIMAATIVEP